MRILHIITTLSSGGAEKMLVDLVREMQKKKIQCEVAVLTKKGDFFGEELSSLNIPIYYGPTNNVYSLKNIIFIGEVLKKNSYDCVHTHLFAPQLFTPIALKLFRKKYLIITTEHSTHNRRRENKLFWLLDYWMYKKYNCIIAISEGTKQQLVKYMPKIEKKIVVINNGIQLEKYKNVLPLPFKELDTSLKNDEKIILMVAAMREEKDHETLIRASKLLPENYRVVFVGDGERFCDVKKYASNYGGNNILFLGRRSDIPSVMATADVFVLSSKWEGFGLAVVEAAASGLPVIASDVDGLRDIVKDIGGFLFKPGNEVDLAKKIQRIIDNNIKNISNKKLEKYSISNTADSYLRLYKKLLKG